MHTQVFLYYVRTCISFIIALLFTYCLQLVACRKECIRKPSYYVAMCTQLSCEDFLNAKITQNQSDIQSLKLVFA